MFALRHRLDRFALFITLMGAALLSACGSGSTFEPLNPTRVISFGDGLSDVGNNPLGGKFTVNDGTVNIWVERVATSYGRTITAQISGGLSFAQGRARVNGANSIAAQISTFLTNNTIGASDLIIVDAGITELAELSADPANSTTAALESAAAAAGRALAAEIVKLTNSGAKYVVVANAINLGQTPFAARQGRAAAFASATQEFNNGLKGDLPNPSNTILYVENQAYITSLYNNPAALGTGGTASVPACATATFNTSTCTTSNTTTLNTSAGVTTATYNLSLFADDRHLTPAAHRLLGDNAFNKIRARW